MRKLLSVDIFDGKSVQTVIQQQGYKVAASDNTDPANRYNFFDILRASASEEKFNKVETDFANGNSDMISLTFKGESYFIYYSALHAGNQENPHANTWHLVIYVPENAVFKTVNEIFNEILTVMLIYSVSGQIKIITNSRFVRKGFSPKIKGKAFFVIHTSIVFRTILYLQFSQ